MIKVETIDRNEKQNKRNSRLKSNNRKVLSRVKKGLRSASYSKRLHNRQQLLHI
jgi:hypothetical protein